MERNEKLDENENNADRCGARREAGCKCSKQFDGNGI